MRLQPVVAEVAVLLVLHHELLVDDGSDRRRQAVEHEGGRVGLVGLEGEGVVARLPDPVLDVLRRHAELVDDEGRRLVEDDGALQREDGVGGRQRVAGGEFQALPDLEGDRLAVVGNLPAVGDFAVHLRDVVQVVADQPLVGVAGDLGGRELEDLGRIERDDVVDRPRLDQRVLRRRGFACMAMTPGDRASAAANTTPKIGFIGWFPYSSCLSVDLLHDRWSRPPEATIDHHKGVGDAILDDLTDRPKRGRRPASGSGCLAAGPRRSRSRRIGIRPCPDIDPEGCGAGTERGSGRGPAPESPAVPLPGNREHATVFATAG